MHDIFETKHWYVKKVFFQECNDFLGEDAWYLKVPIGQLNIIDLI